MKATPWSPGVVLLLAVWGLAILATSAALSALPAAACSVTAWSRTAEHHGSYMLTGMLVLCTATSFELRISNRPEQECDSPAGHACFATSPFAAMTL